MPSSNPPMGIFRNFLGAISGTYVLRLDLTTATAFRSQGLALLNHDASIVITVSFDGVTGHIELDPVDAAGVILDNFYPTGGTVYAIAASGTPRFEAYAWA